ncbi:MAG TPA: DegV family protein [Candidatus Eisenbergiella merdipullorum]|uniref:DegV family protein n=1 Tax=Candidatus Eisenbergiella merdipullorum TaxID=2838553 RepID=A0A9D2IA94_9FIRM|nr:DegV family protein [Candidatus Eisenbergiella merdipullorum]
MSKIAIVTDSNSGITQAEAEKLGIYVLPMPFMIGGETFFEGINLTQEEFYEKLRTGVPVSTSQPAPDSVLRLWRRILLDYDQIVHIPMSSGLSGSCQTAMMLSEEFDGRVQVVNNQRISVTQRRSVEDAIRLAGKGMDAVEIKEFLEKDKFNSSIYIMVDTLYYLKKGGRITPAAAALGTLLRLKPVLQIQGEKLDAFAKARTTTSARQIMLNAVINDVTGRFGQPLENCGMWIDFAHTQNEEAAGDFQKEVLSHFPGAQSHIDPLSLSVSCHIGPGALAVAVTKRND